LVPFVETCAQLIVNEQLSDTVTEFTEAQPSTDDFKSNASTVGNAVRQRVDYEIFDALKEKADVEDRRAIFF
jgi:hypothetical protein